MGSYATAPVTKGRARVPVIMEMTSQECGAACLAMVLAYYGKWVPLEEVAKDCNVFREGSQLENIIRAANGHGLVTETRKMEAEALCSKGRFPCILRWKRNQYTVLCGTRGNSIFLNDPALGDLVLSMEDFRESYGGECLFLEPGPTFERVGEKKGQFLYLEKKLIGIRYAMVFVALVTATISFMTLFRSMFSRIFLERMLTQLEPTWTVPFLWGLSAITIVELTALWVKAVYSLRLEGKLAVSGNSNYMWKVLNLPMEFFSQRGAGDLQKRMKTNALMAHEMIETLAPLAINTFMMVFYLVVMFRYSLLLTLIGIVSLLIQGWTSKLIADKRANSVRAMLRASNMMASEITSGIEMIETVKANAVEAGLFEKWVGYLAGNNNSFVRFMKIEKYYGTIPQAISSVTDVLILVLGIYLTMQGQFTAGMLMAFQSFLKQFMGPVQILLSSGKKAQELRSKAEQLEDVMSYPSPEVFKKEDGGDSAQETYEKLTGNLVMRDVTFGYSRLKPPLIEDFRLELRPGQKVAFVGASGCGKSTLSKLLTGLYSPWSGEILFDGKKLSEIDARVFSDSVAMVEQEITLFEDTVANNIKMWDDSIDDQEMIRACKDARIHDDILQREGGYSYRIVEGGKDFSGGQRQRMEIARALVKNPSILIMDEATSALDATTEFEVMQTLAARGIVCVIIAHRLSTIRDCDEIIVLDHGKVVERGTHEQLLALNGRYKTLVSSQ